MCSGQITISLETEDDILEWILIQKIPEVPVPRFCIRCFRR